MEADSSAPANIALALARGAASCRASARSPIRQALSPLATREFVVPGTHTPYLRHEQVLPLSWAIVAARVRALAGHFLERTRIGRFHVFRPMTMFRALVTIRSPSPKPQ
jgi:hypothetical protein